jgi:hypothetical protein
MEIILIDTGVFQKYIHENIKNLKAFGNYNITVITDKALSTHFTDVNVVFTEDLQLFNFDKRTKLEKGFWANTSKRLFILYSYMNKFNKTNCIHIENDYLIYFKASNLHSSNENGNFDLENKVWVTIDDGNRCIPGIIFIPDTKSLDSLIKNYNFKENDMVNMYNFYDKNRETVACLPLFNDYTHFKKWNLIFDAASIGQYLGGMDTIHPGGGIPGYINPLLKVDCSKYIFYWKKENNLYIPTIKIKNQLIPIAGLHVHSKHLSNFQSDDPLEDRLIKKNNTYFISFAEGSQDYREALVRITSQANEVGVFSEVHGYTGDELKSLPFWEKHSEFILNNPKGYGYYLWKPYLILEKMKTIEDNDILWYADSGCEIDIRKKDLMLKVLELTEKNEVVCSMNCLEKEYTKRDLLVYLDMDKPCYTNDTQYEATSICFKKCKKTMDFINEWYTIAQNYNLIDESPSKMNEYREFVQNRYDQSVFSLLMKKYYHYDRTFLIGKAIELSRNRTGTSWIKYIFKSTDPFDWRQYISNYPDLKHLNEQDALKHWNRFGKIEGRSFFKMK